MIVLFAWRALRHDERWSRRWVLLALRLGAVAAALVLFFEPAVRLQNVTRLPNHVAVLVDGSESMRLAEKPGEPSRAARAATWLRDQKDALARLSREHVVDFYTFGRRALTVDARVADDDAADARRQRRTCARRWRTCARATKGAISAA